MNEEVNPEVKPEVQSEVQSGEVKSHEEVNKSLTEQCNYAQKIINILQVKVNEANGIIVQLEAKLQLAQEDKESILKQVETMGILPK